VSSAQQSVNAWRHRQGPAGSPRFTIDDLDEAGAVVIQQHGVPAQAENFTGPESFVQN
jgi:hypothetical protein